MSDDVKKKRATFSVITTCKKFSRSTPGRSWGRHVLANVVNATNGTGDCH